MTRSKSKNTLSYQIQPVNVPRTVAENGALVQRGEWKAAEYRKVLVFSLLKWRSVSDFEICKQNTIVVTACFILAL